MVLGKCLEVIQKQTNKLLKGEFFKDEQPIALEEKTLSKEKKTSDEFVMSLRMPPHVSKNIDIQRKKQVKISRNHWVLQAVLEKLERDDV